MTACICSADIDATTENAGSATMQTRTRIFRLSQTFISHTHEGYGVSQSRLPLLLPKCPEKPDSYLRVIAMVMGLPVHGSRKQLPHSIVFVSHCRHVLKKKKNARN